MQMKKVLRGAMLGAVSAAWMVTGAAAPARAETLADALIMAYQNSDLLDQNQALLRAADENVAQAVAALRPVIAFIGSAGYTDTNITNSITTTSATINLSLSLFDGGQNQLAIESAKESVLSTRASLKGIEQNVLLSAVQAYMDVKSATENVALSQSNVRLITQQLRATKDRFDVGEVTRTDVSLAQSRLATSNSGLVAAQGALNTAREAYRAAIGQYPGKLANVGNPPSLPKTLNDARAIAQRTHPNIEAAQRQVTVSEYTMQRARAARGPQVSLDASYTKSQGGTSTGNVGLALNQTLYSGGALKSVERQALANRDASRGALHRSVRLVEQAVGNAWSNLAVSRAQIVANDQRIRAAQLAYDGTKEEARLGSRTTLDVLDAEQELLDARTARVTAAANLYVAYYQVLSSMGLLTVDHLKLGIVTYDPADYYNAVKSAPEFKSPQGDKLNKVLKSIGRN